MVNISQSSNIVVQFNIGFQKQPRFHEYLGRVLEFLSCDDRENPKSITWVCVKVDNFISKMKTNMGLAENHPLQMKQHLCTAIDPSLLDSI